MVDSFSLAEEIGSPVPSGDTKTISIVAGGEQRTITLLYVERGSGDRQAEAALKLWRTIRSLFVDDSATRAGE